MSDSYTIELQNAVGTPVKALDNYISFECAQSIHNVGSMTLRVPDQFPMGYFRRDMRLMVRRNFVGSGSYLVGRSPWFIRSAEFSEDDERWTLTAVDKLDILRRPIIAYPPESLYADKTIENGNEAYHDNMMKAYVRENLGTLALDGARDLSGYIEVEPDTSLTQYTEKQAGWRNLLATLKELADDAKNLGYNIFFDLIYHEDRDPQFLFVVRQNFLGADRASMGQVKFSRVLRNLRNATVKYDYTEEATYAYVGGEGQDLDRLIWEVPVQNAIDQSPFGRVEIFVDAREAIEETVLEAEGRSELTRQRAKIVLAAELLETSRQLFLRDFGYGDRVPVSVRGVEFLAIIDAYRLSHTRGQTTQLDIRVQAEQEL